ncbi:hypothetical protein [Actinomadura sp. BRA 177]|uniref:baeRF3 domain-containing protein n=1 Tax=Actinomadura sp. BRA 177 TaxID=2745202 RepID=UPI0015960168|nr:hypothetical protein [Actinomadura sp. BRA 177]
MDLVTRADLVELTQREPKDAHVSLFIPTDRSSTPMSVQADRIAWRNLLTGTESVLSQQGMRAPDIAELLAPAWDLHKDEVAWRYMSDGLALFLRPGWHRSFRVPVGLPEVGAVGDRFIIGPLLRIIASDRHFLLLALSQQQIRVLDASMQRVDELELRDVPTSLREVIEPPEARSDTMARLTSGGAGGPGRRAVFYGHAAAEKHHQKEEARQFLLRVNEGLREYLGDQDLPMVPMGLDYLVAMYREVNTYPHLTEESVLHNPDRLSPEELHAAAWPVIESIADRQAGEALDRFADLHGTGYASADPGKIEQAAEQGRVDTLLLGDQAWCWEGLPSTVPVVRLGAGGPTARCEQLDRTAGDTLARGGRLFVSTAPEILDGSDAVAIFRY